MTLALEAVSELLKKQKRVEGMVHSQNMPRQAIVETLVQRQHLAELQNLLAQWPASEIGGVLDALPVDDARLLWAQIPSARQNDVLWEISDARRELLAADREPAFDESQMNAFVLADGRLQHPSGSTCLVPARPRETMWVRTLG